MANLPIPAPLSDVDYEQIEGAVMETARGRWFLAEYARSNRNADTTMLLKALDRIEGAMRGEHSVEPVERIRYDLVEMAKAIARTKTEIASMKPDADHHGKFGEASEELDSVVLATEAATSDILACAESIHNASNCGRQLTSCAVTQITPPSSKMARPKIIQARNFPIIESSNTKLLQCFF